MPKDDDLAAVTAMADRMQLEGNDREKYVRDHMQRFGYKPRMDWDEPDPEEGQEEEREESFFTKKREEKQQREVRPPAAGKGTGTDGSKGKSWQYEE
jgi:hypothetical protein